MITGSEKIITQNTIFPPEQASAPAPDTGQQRSAVSFLALGNCLLDVFLPEQDTSCTRLAAGGAPGNVAQALAGHGYSSVLIGTMGSDETSTLFGQALEHCASQGQAGHILPELVQIDGEPGGRAEYPPGSARPSFLRVPPIIPLHQQIKKALNSFQISVCYIDGYYTAMAPDGAALLSSVLATCDVLLDFSGGHVARRLLEIILSVLVAAGRSKGAGRLTVIAGFADGITDGDLEGIEQAMRARGAGDVLVKKTAGTALIIQKAGRPPQRFQFTRETFTTPIGMGDAFAAALLATAAAAAAETSLSTRLHHAHGWAIEWAHSFNTRTISQPISL